MLGWKDEIPSEVNTPLSLRSVVKEGYARPLKSLKRSCVCATANESVPSKLEWKAQIWIFSLYLARVGLERMPIILLYPSGQLMHHAPVNSTMQTCLSNLFSTTDVAPVTVIFIADDSNPAYFATKRYSPSTSGTNTLPFNALAS